MLRVLLFSVMAFAAAREHGAHVHGEAHMNLAFDGKSGKIELNTPAMAVYGFEYAAKSAKDRKAKDDGLKKLEEKIADIVVFDPSLKCEIKKDIFEVDQKDVHSDVDAEFQIKCDKSPMGTNVTFNMQKVFPRIKTLKVDVMVENVQKSQDIQKNGDVIELKQAD